MSSNRDSSRNPYYIGAAVTVGVAAAVGIGTIIGTILYEIFKEQPQGVSYNDSRKKNQRMQEMQKELEEVQKARRQKKALKWENSDAASTSSSSSMKTARTSSSTATMVTAFDNIEDLDAYVSYDDKNPATKAIPIEKTLQNLDKILSDDSTNFLVLIEEFGDRCYETPENPELLWRLGQAHYKLATIITNVTDQLTHIKNGISACESALKINPKTGNAHKWICNLMGLRFSHLSSIKEQLDDGYLFKEHIYKAVELLPNDSESHHMLGRFLYELANLNWFQRFTASAIREPPPGSFDEALIHLTRADRLSQTKKNKLFIAKTYIGLGYYTRAAETLRDARRITNSRDSDPDVNSEVEELYQKYITY